MTKEKLRDLSNLSKYPEFYALQQELLGFCREMDDLEEIELEKTSRISLVEEVAGRKFASMKVKELLIRLGLITKKDLSNREVTYE